MRASLPRFLAVCFVVGAVLTQMACSGDARRGTADIQVRWSLSPSPPEVGKADIRLTVSDMDWSPRNGARVVLTARRDSVTMAVDTAVGQGAGQYLVRDFVFQVSGDWTLSARVETPDGRWAEVDHDVDVSGGKG